jgi:hypothetical protein
MEYAQYFWEWVLKKSSKCLTTIPERFSTPDNASKWLNIGETVGYEALS